MVVALDDGHVHDPRLSTMTLDSGVIQLLPVAMTRERRPILDFIGVLAEGSPHLRRRGSEGRREVRRHDASKGHRHTSSIHAMVSEGARMSANAARIGALTTLSVIAS